MSLVSFISDIRSKIFGLNNKRPIIGKVTPIFDDQYVPDLELGDGLFYRRLIARQQALEPESRLYYDLEVGDKSVIIVEIDSPINIGQKSEFIEKYITYSDIVHYFGWKSDKEYIDCQSYNLPALRSSSTPN